MKPTKRNFYLALDENEVPFAAFFATSPEMGNRWLNAQGIFPTYFDEISLDDINGGSTNDEYTNPVIVNMVAKMGANSPKKGYAPNDAALDRLQFNFGCTGSLHLMPGAKRLKASDYPWR